MKSDYELYEEMNALQNQLTQAIRQLKIDGERYANAEKDYKITLRQNALRLRAEDMAITLIDKIVYGIEDVANKRFERDKSEMTVQRAINKLINNNLIERIGSNKTGYWKER